MTNVPRLRLGLFIDGTYFNLVSNHYGRSHPIGHQIDHLGLVLFLKNQIPRRLGIDADQVSVSERHKYMGMPTNYSEQLIERSTRDLATLDIELHVLPIIENGEGVSKERGADMQMGLDAFELAAIGDLDIVVLVTGDGDFIPLTQKLRNHKKKSVLLYWNFPGTQGIKGRSIGTSADLVTSVDLAINMVSEIDRGLEKEDLGILNIFGIKEPRQRLRPPKNVWGLDPPLMGFIDQIEGDKGYIRPMTGGQLIEFYKKDFKEDEWGKSLKGKIVQYRLLKGVPEIRAINVKLAEKPEQP